MNKVNVIIPMAGHSRRFHQAGYVGPKALLSVGFKRMIEHVVDMFDTTLCHYHIVINSMQLSDDPDLIDYLAQLAVRVNVVVVENHELGPVYSVLQVDGIGDEEEVIISYCDFIVDWDYSYFMRHVSGEDGGIVSFRGFHPASFGDTYYAYLNVDGDRMVELREKRSFTQNRSQEHASAGIYYFKRFDTFKKYGQKWLNKENKILPEAYVSLLYNDMVLDNLSVIVHEVGKFICLGTPDDYEQYQFWWKYFTEEPKSITQGNRDVTRIGLIPMAGMGSRFREYGYRVAKPLIHVQGSPMVFKTVRSMPEQDRWIFLPRQEDLTRHPIEKALRSFSDHVIIHGVQEHTTGQAATCMLVSDHIDDDAELIIASADYEHRYDSKLWREVLDDPTIDGAIWTYRSGSMMLKNPEMFAYCCVEEDGVTISKIVEKDTISETPNLDPLVVGTFWYRRGSDFKVAAKNMINRDITVNGEHYVGTSINYLIESGKKFVIFDIRQWISFGDPFELKVLEYWEEYFNGEY